jgi:hypothetical protein
LRTEARHLLKSALESLTLAVEVFNRPTEAGRQKGTLIFLQQACEMLLKAIIFQRRGRIRDPGEDNTYVFNRCLNIAVSDLSHVTDDEAVTLRILSTQRGDAQHYLIRLEEDLLYVIAQASVNVFASVLERAFQEKLEEYLPRRALPVAGTPPTDLATVVSRSVGIVQELLKPGRRRSTEARARLRAILDIDAGVGGREEAPTEKEVDRAVRSVRRGRKWEAIFPGVATLRLDPEAGTNPLAVRVTRGEGPAVRRVAPGEEALLYREVNPLDRYSMSFTEFAERFKPGLTPPRVSAAIEALGLDKDEECCKDIRIGSMEFRRYSPKAIERLRADLAELDLDKAWTDYRRRHSRVTAGRS